PTWEASGPLDLTLSSQSRGSDKPDIRKMVCSRCHNDRFLFWLRLFSFGFHPQIPPRRQKFKFPFDTRRRCDGWTRIAKIQFPRPDADYWVSFKLDHYMLELIVGFLHLE
ncbi:MAG: hypothetical protein H6Q05_2363, partial [Acidobacteria bacterium]|nr:hypothetical protein [Acidobacteriota bacterium]